MSDLYQFGPFAPAPVVVTNSGASNYTSDGSPEGVIAAAQGSRCWDETNKEDYIKDSGGTSDTGWVRVTQNG